MDVELINDDVLSALHDRGDKEVDVVFTSPPYNIGIDYGGEVDDTKDPVDYVEWITEVMSECEKVLKDEGSIFLNLSGTPTKPLLPFETILAIVNGTGLKLQNSIQWVKSAYVPFKEEKGKTVGHFKPINSKRFLNDTHEFVFHLTKTGAVTLDRLRAGVEYEDSSNTARWQSGHRKRCRGNVWFVPYKTIRSRKGDRPHPATYPVELVEIALNLHGHADVVMDPFNGIGNTALAAKNFGSREYVGIDINPEFLDVTLDRLGNI